MPRYGWYVEKTAGGVASNLLKDVTYDEGRGRMYGTTFSGKNVRLNPRVLLLDWSTGTGHEELRHEIENHRSGIDLELLLESVERGETTAFDELVTLYYGPEALPAEKIALYEILTAHHHVFTISLKRSGLAVSIATEAEVAHADKLRKEEELHRARASAWVESIRRWDCLEALPTGLDQSAADELAEAIVDHQRNVCQDEAFHLARRRLEQAIGPDRTTERFFALARHRRNLDELEMHRLRLEAQLPAFFSPVSEETTSMAVDALSAVNRDLPVSEELVYTIDDEGTRDFDDGISCRVLDDGRILLGVHIAAAAAVVSRVPPLEKRARDLGTTVYLPHESLPMLPTRLSESLLSLVAGEERPALSYLFTFDPGHFEPVDRRVELNLVNVAGNLSYDELSEMVGVPLFPCYEEGIGESELTDRLPNVESVSYPAEAGKDLIPCWPFVAALTRYRYLKRFETVGSLILRREYKIRADAQTGRVRLQLRHPFHLAEQLVAECMILVNETGGNLLAGNDVEAIFRSQSVMSGGFSGFSRSVITTRPESHGALGVGHYAWQSSPLRRYVDYENQKQLLYMLDGSGDLNREPNYLLMVAKDTDSRLKQASRSEATFRRYWVLRHLREEGIGSIEAEITGFHRGSRWARAKQYPLTFPVPGSTERLSAGDTIGFTILGVDLANLELILEMM